MKDLFDRLSAIARARLSQFKNADSAPDPKTCSSDDAFSREWERPEQNNPYETFYPQQVIDDLAAFGLKAPSSLEEIRKARNREYKKYHSDMFMHDQEKQDAANELMQLLNTAYDRLQKYYQK